MPAPSSARWRIYSQYKLLCFIQLTNFFCKEEKALAFNWDRCYHLALCLQLILFHFVPCHFTECQLHHPLDGTFIPEYELLCFIQLPKFFCKEEKALAFNRDGCCHLALCLQLILFHFVPYHFTECQLHHPLDGAFIPEYKLLCFIQITQFFW
jgi:hypothetical protein